MLLKGVSFFARHERALTETVLMLTESAALKRPKSDFLLTVLTKKAITLMDIDIEESRRDIHADQYIGISGKNRGPCAK